MSTNGCCTCHMWPTSVWNRPLTRRFYLHIYFLLHTLYFIRIINTYSYFISNQYVHNRLSLVLTHEPLTLKWNNNPGNIHLLLFAKGYHQHKPLFHFIGAISPHIGATDGAGKLKWTINPLTLDLLSRRVNICLNQ